MEPFIDEEWTKWSNNFNYLNKHSSRLEQELTQALTHFSFHYTDGAFMLRDLQGSFDGALFTLSDPCLVSAEPAGGLLGPTDSGAAGINSFFFRQHKVCNQFCGKDWARPKEKLEELV